MLLALLSHHALHGICGPTRPATICEIERGVEVSNEQVWVELPCPEMGWRGVTPVACKISGIFQSKISEKLGCKKLFS